MRPPTACVACRNRRRKCEVEAPGQACKYCRLRDAQCSFTATAINTTTPTSSTWNGASPATPHVEHFPNLSGDILPPYQLCVKLVELYFNYIHDTFHSLFHRPSVMEDLANGILPRVILLSIISLSARFSNDEYFANVDPRIRGRPFAHEAEQLVNLREISVSTIQACVLVGAYLVTEGEAASEALYYGIACRLAMLLDLPNMPVNTRLEQEINIRVWWTLSMIDVWSSNGIRVPRALTPHDNVPFPMEEIVFLDLRRENYDLPSPTMLQESSASLLTQMVKLNAILTEISQMNQAAAATGVYSFEFDATVDALTAKLDGWYNSLPLQLRDTPENLAYFASLGLGGVFVAVYLGYYHYGQLLYYQYLHEDSYNDPSGQMAHQHLSSNVASGHYASNCKSHSTALCEILYRSYATPGAEVYYTMVGHVLVIASTVQLHILLFSSDDTQCRSARYRLERNFEILTRLQGLWPTLDVCFTRFREFHKACQKSKESSFRMDRWMLQFLFEFAKPVDEKTDQSSSHHHHHHHHQRFGSIDGDSGEGTTATADATSAAAAEDDGFGFGTLSELRPWSMTDLGFSPF